MTSFETLLTRAKPEDNLSIPVEAFDHLQAMKTDRCFVGSAVFSGAIVPVLFLKLASRTAKKVGMPKDSLYRPSYKFNCVETLTHDMVMTMTLLKGGHRSLHIPLNPGNERTRAFMQLAQKFGGICLDVTVEKKGDQYGTTEFLEVDGDHAEWMGRNLIRSRSISADNDWKAAFDGFLGSRYATWKDHSLAFDQPDGFGVDALRSERFVSRAKSSNEPDFTPIDKFLLNEHNYDWLRREHGIEVEDNPLLLTTNEELKRDFLTANLEQSDAASARVVLEDLRNRYPGEVIVLSRLLLVYIQLKNRTGERSVQKEMKEIADRQVLAALLSMDKGTPPWELPGFHKRWPHADVRKYFARERPVELTEFILFESMWITYLASQNRVVPAVERFNRYVEFGATEDHVSAAAEEITRAVIGEQIERTGKPPRLGRYPKWSGAGPAATKFLNAAYRDNLSYLLNELKKEGYVPAPPTVVRSKKRIGRNDPCPCGSGLKYKRCCGGAG